MKRLKRVCSLLLLLAIALTCSVTACAAVEDTGFDDVAADAWYADAAVYVRDSGVMGGTSATAFAPRATMTRAMLATVLYRAAGNPAVSGTSVFSDVAEDAYYSSAVSWAAENGVVSGYGNGLFGADDPVSREQIATILWRYDGGKTAETASGFTDSDLIAAYAAPAVDWAVESGIVTGMEDGSFAPKGQASRAQVAVMLYRYLSAAETQPTDPDASTDVTEPEQPAETDAVLVAYFSNTGTTQAVAAHIADVTGGTLFEITAAEPYTAEDLNYNNDDCRANQERNDPNARPTIAGSVENMDSYDVIYLGYPIWWGEAPKIMRTFVESYDLSGKTIVPFCTSASSGIGASATELHTLAADATWLDGMRFGSGTSRETVQSWIETLD